MNIIIALLIFGIIVLVHEFGHYIVAKKGGVFVEEFAIGMGPKLVGFRKNGTLYSIRLLPIGGFCKMLGEDEESKDERAFNNKSVWVRMATIFAGPLFNFVLAFILGLFIIGAMGFASNEVSDVVEGLPAQRAGLQAGDRILKINNSKMYTNNDISFYIQNHIGEELKITYKRGAENNTVTVIPEKQENGGYLIGITTIREKGNFFEVVKYSFYEVGFWIKATVQSIGKMVAGKVSTKEVAGPVGIINVISESYEQGLRESMLILMVNLARISLLLSANLGVMNLLPIPALDGSRLIFLAVEAVRGKPVNRNKEGFVHFIGFVLLMALMVFVMFNDIRNIILK